MAGQSAPEAVAAEPGRPSSFGSHWLWLPQLRRFPASPLRGASLTSTIGACEREDLSRNRQQSLSHNKRARPSRPLHPRLTRSDCWGTALELIPATMSFADLVSVDRATAGAGESTNRCSFFASRQSTNC